MDLHLTPEAEKFRDDLRAWLSANLDHPYTQDVLDAKNDEDSLVEVRRAFQKKLNDAGYLGMAWPAEWGGRGATQIEEAILKAVAAFANTEGGTLLIGVDNSGEILGLENDYASLKADRDKFEVYLQNMLTQNFGAAFCATAVKMTFPVLQGA